MNAARVSDEDYIQFLIATPSACSAAEAAKSQPRHPAAPAHDAFTRLLNRLEPDAKALWDEVRPLLGQDGVLVLDDTTLDKPYARKIDLVSRHWSGKHKAVVKGINLVTAVWYDGGQILPIDYRVSHPKRLDADGRTRTKNDHFADRLKVTKARGQTPRCVLFDGWYASLENLKLVRELAWTFLTRFKSNRLVRVNRGDLLSLSSQEIAAEGTVVWLPGYGELKVFRVTAPDGGAEHFQSPIHPGPRPSRQAHPNIPCPLSSAGANLSVFRQPGRAW